jgi:hypothetical protein
MRLGIIEINIGAQRLQGNLPLHFFFRPRDFRAAQPTTTHHLNTLRAGPHRLLHRLFHRAPERHALLKLLSNAPGNQKRIYLRLPNLHNIQPNLLGRIMLKLLAQSLDLLAALANHNPWLGRVNRHRNLPGGRPLDLDLGNASHRQLIANDLAQTQVFGQQIFVGFFGKPARLPALNHTKPEANRVYFMPQNCPSLEPFYSVFFAISANSARSLEPA